MTLDLEAASQGLPSRRTVLGALAAGLGVALVGPVTQATAAGAVVDAAPLPGLTTVATSATSVVRVPTLLGAQLKVATRAVQAGSTVAVAFDDRVYSTAPPRLISAAGQVVACRLTHTSGAGSSGLATATVVLDQALVPGQTYALSLGLRRLVRYPHDVVAAPLPIRITVTDQTVVDGTSARRLATSPEVEHAVWGLCVGVGWQAVHWGNGFHSWTPELVTVAATGPSDVPAGTVVSATLDGRLFRQARFAPLTGRTSPGPDARRADDVLRVHWALPAPLAAGRRVSVRLVADLAPLSEALPELHPPTVTVQAASTAVGQRITGLESASREDSAYDVPSRLTYGLDLVSPLKPR